MTKLVRSGTRLMTPSFESSASTSKSNKILKQLSSKYNKSAEVKSLFPGKLVLEPQQQRRDSYRLLRNK